MDPRRQLATTLKLAHRPPAAPAHGDITGVASSGDLSTDTPEHEEAVDVEHENPAENPAEDTAENTAVDTAVDTAADTAEDTTADTADNVEDANTPSPAGNSQHNRTKRKRKRLVLAPRKVGKRKALQEPEGDTEPSPPVVGAEPRTSRRTRSKTARAEGIDLLVPILQVFSANGADPQ